MGYQTWAAMAATLAASFGLAAAQTSQPQTAQPLARTLTVYLDLTTSPDGKVSKVAMGSGYPEPIRALVEKRVATWRFAQFIWKGKPASPSFYRFLKLQAVPTTSGGYAMRAHGFSYNSYPAVEFMPPNQQRRWFGMRTGFLLAYQVEVSESGVIGNVTRVASEKFPGQGGHQLDRSLQEMLRAWHLKPFLVDGKPVPCNRIYVSEHTPDRTGTHQRNNQEGWADEIDIGKLPADQAQFLKTQVEALQDSCTPPALVTPIESVLL